jgi:stress-induced morphogen
MVAQQVDFDALQPRVEVVLRQRFPENTTIVYQKGMRGHVHVKIVSEEFNGLSEEAKQQLMWRVLDSELGADALGVALVMAYGTDELP